MDDNMLHSIISDAIEEQESILSSPESPQSSDSPTEQEVLIIQQGLSSDELVSDSDIATTEKLIEQGRLEDALYGQWTMWGIVTKCSINLFLPFINGMMLGFGELLAHEIGFRYNWIGARVSIYGRIKRM